MKPMNNRRQFLKNASLGGLLAVSIPDIVSAAYSTERSKKIQLQKDDILLFQGDSITDAHRKKEDKEANSPAGLGSGYPVLAAAGLLKKFPGKGLHIYNRGISGNKVYQLAERWDADCLELKPTVLSILVGVNDFWHTLVNGYKGTLKTYQDDYKTLLDRTKQQLPELKLIIGEPYAVIGVKAVDASWYPAFNDYRQAAKEIAESYGAVFIPYQAIYDKALQSAPGSYWTADGVHPSLAGAQLMAEAWQEAVKG